MIARLKIVIDKEYIFLNAYNYIIDKPLAIFGGHSSKY